MHSVSYCLVLLIMSNGVVLYHPQCSHCVNMLP
jgi:hypothetical protein